MSSAKKVYRLYRVALHQGSSNKKKDYILGNHKLFLEQATHVVLAGDKVPFW